MNDTILRKHIDSELPEPDREIIDPGTPNYRFFGESSGADLIQTALDLKSEYNGTEPELTRIRAVNRRPEFWTQDSVSSTLGSSIVVRPAHRS